jgi:hypothetical protein
MGVAKDEGTKFHDGDETREIHDFRVRISAIEDTR